jgi:hypothetical protein
MSSKYFIGLLMSQSVSGNFPRIFGFFWVFSVPFNIFWGFPEFVLHWKIISEENKTYPFLPGPSPTAQPSPSQPIHQARKAHRPPWPSRQNHGYGRHRSLACVPRQAPPCTLKGDSALATACPSRPAPLCPAQVHHRRSSRRNRAPGLPPSPPRGATGAVRRRKELHKAKPQLHRRLPSWVNFRSTTADFSGRMPSARAEQGRGSCHRFAAHGSRWSKLALLWGSPRRTSHPPPLPVARDALECHHGLYAEPCIGLRPPPNLDRSLPPQR